MTIFPIFYAVIENDLRRVLAYSLNNQLGFMVVGIGIGTPLALNGAIAHAFCHIIYKSLLFMSIGAVMLRVGTAKATELGGLYRSMPFTMIFCVIAAASISAFPLFSGFISKSPILSESLHSGYSIVWLLLLFASAGVFHHSGIKIPYFTFFAHDSGKRVQEAPPHMLLAMGAAAFLCIALGVYPDMLYALLPYRMNGYSAYDLSHVLGQMELLIFSALAFSVLMLSGLYPPEMRSVNLDSDWIYRKIFPRFLSKIYALYGDVRKKNSAAFYEGIPKSDPHAADALWIARAFWAQQHERDDGFLDRDHLGMRLYLVLYLTPNHNLAIGFAQ